MTTSTTTIASHQPAQANRVPVPGSIITRLYKGNTLHVKVLQTGFEHEGEV